MDPKEEDKKQKAQGLERTTASQPIPDYTLFELTITQRKWAYGSLWSDPAELNWQRDALALLSLQQREH